MRSFYWGLIALLMTVGCASTSNGKKSYSKQDQINMTLDVATAALAEGDATSALISLNEVKELDSKLPYLHYLYALAYYKKGDLNLATDSAKTAVKLDPKYSQAKNTLGKLLMDQKKYPEAETYLSEAANDLTNRDGYLAKINLGILYFKQSKTELALRYFNQALNDEPDAACTAAYYRGQIELDRNDLFKAQSDFERSSKATCTKLTDAHLALGKTFIRLKKFDLARAKLLEVQQLFPHSDAAISASQLMKEIP